jgi:hypothetical protein
LRDWFKIGAWNVALVLLAIALVDVGLRWTFFDEARHPAVDDPPGYYVTDPELGVTLAKNIPVQTFRFRGPSHKVFTNEIGCFDKPVKLKSDEAFILVTGDSYTWGFAQLEAKWASHIERRTGIRVLKCGIYGTGTQHQLARLKRLYERLPHPPSLVIHLYDTTDFNDDFTFPSYTLIANQHIEAFARIRLADGYREALSAARRAEIKQIILTGPRGFLEQHSTLYNIVKMGLFVDARIERRRLVIEGKRETHLTGKYDFNLLLLDGDVYPFVARQLEAHIGRIRQMRDFVLERGGKYAMFHTNSFRLPEERPLVRRLKQFLDGFEPFLGWMPELAKYRFDGHWTPASNGQAATVMIRLLTEKGYLPLEQPALSERR